MLNLQSHIILHRLTRWVTQPLQTILVFTLIASFIGYVPTGNAYTPVNSSNQNYYNNAYYQQNRPQPRPYYVSQTRPSTQQPTYQGQVQQNKHRLGANQNISENLLLILDSSQSMAEKLSNGSTKMVEAKRTILNVIQRTPDNINLGLRVYGHRWTPRNSCRESELMVPMGHNNRMQIASRMVSIKPEGATPISYSIHQAVYGDLRNVMGKKSIILISDGLENCDEDPCELVVKLLRSGVDIKINVIGYGLTDALAEKQLKCVALATKGRYYTADTSAQLARGLDELFHAKQEVNAKIITRPRPVQKAPTRAPKKPLEPYVPPMIDASGR